MISCSTDADEGEPDPTVADWPECARETGQCFQFARAESGRHANTNRAHEVSVVRSPLALSGVAACGTCSASMTISHHMSGKRRIRCAGRGQGSGCDEPSCFAHVIEDQIGALLAAFAVPAATQQRLLNLWHHYHSRDVSTSTTRIRLQRKLRRLKELYLEGDLTKREFQVQKANVTHELAALPLEGNPDNDDGARLASYLSDVSRAWLVATPEERNKLARQLFLRVVVKNKTAVAVVPRPDIRPFFTHVFEDEITYRRKRRGSVRRLHYATYGHLPSHAGNRPRDGRLRQPIEPASTCQETDGRSAGGRSAVCVDAIPSRTGPVLRRVA